MGAAVALFRQVPRQRFSGDWKGQVLSATIDLPSDIQRPGVSFTLFPDFRCSSLATYFHRNPFALSSTVEDASTLDPFLLRPRVTLARPLSDAWSAGTRVKVPSCVNEPVDGVCAAKFENRVAELFDRTGTRRRVSPLLPRASFVNAEPRAALMERRY